jgi:hypothetical protein
MREALNSIIKSFKSIFLIIVTFLFLSYFGASQEPSREILKDFRSICCIISLPAIAGSIVGLMMVNEPSFVKVGYIRVSNFHLTSILGALTGGSVIFLVSFLISLGLGSDLRINIGSILPNTLTGVYLAIFFGLPFGALGSSSVIEKRYYRNLSIAMVGLLLHFIYNKIYNNPLNSDSFVYLLVFPSILVSIMGFEIRYLSFNLQHEGFNRTSILIILLSSAWIGICLGIWLKLRLLNVLLAFSAFLSCGILLFVLNIHRKAFRNN